MVNLATVWTVLFKEPSRYNWLLQYYLRAEGVTFSWVGTGRCLSSMDFTEEDYHDLQEKLVGAAQKMKDEPGGSQRRIPGEGRKICESVSCGKCWGVSFKCPGHYDILCGSDATKRRRPSRFPQQWSQPIFSSVELSVFIYCYVFAFADLTTAMCLGLAALFVRQFGHAILEPPCHDKEALLLGYNTRNKTMIVRLCIDSDHSDSASRLMDLDIFSSLIPPIALNWFLWTLLVVLGRVTYLVWKHDFRISMIWFIKLITDPLTDIFAYFPRWPQRA